jgi:hypothetical protein
MTGLDTFLCISYYRHIGKIMNGTANHEGCMVETSTYGSDFQLLTLKEKKGILKNAKSLLKLQRDNAVLVAGAWGAAEGLRLKGVENDNRSIREGPVDTSCIAKKIRR